MREISPRELLEQLQSDVEMFVADSDVQNAFVDEKRVPAEEIALQFYDLVDVSLHRLRGSGLIDAQDEMLLIRLDVYVKQVQPLLFINRSHYVDGWYVTDAPEWQRVRELAAAALASLRRPTDDKDPGPT